MIVHRIRSCAWKTRVPEASQLLLQQVAKAFREHLEGEEAGADLRQQAGSLEALHGCIDERWPPASSTQSLYNFQEARAEELLRIQLVNLWVALCVLSFNACSTLQRLGWCPQSLRALRPQLSQQLFCRWPRARQLSSIAPPPLRIVASVREMHPNAMDEIVVRDPTLTHVVTIFLAWLVCTSCPALTWQGGTHCIRHRLCMYTLMSHQT
mmetsp:Transcript_153991/g.271930  ORF Transcript_153991/g.271930 Transcript_153991/m.271930 type:complete len:210 (+) Transcript_153991:639-1268(+)